MEVPKIFGRYQPIRVLGAGSRSRVMMVRDLMDNEVRALKVLLDETGTEGFFREFEILASINHPQVIKVFDFGQDGSGLRYFTMEYLPGRPLAAPSAEPLSMSRIRTIATQLLSALAAIHTRGIIHADLKPHNIFLVEEGEAGDRIKLLDFGLAGHRRDADPGLRRGTLPYMAPEWFQDARVDHRSDLYSAGVVLYELLTGRTPFAGAEPSELIQLKIRDNPPSVRALRPDASPELVRLVNWLLERDPTLRPQSATDALRALQDEFAMASSSSAAGVLTGLPLVGRSEHLEMVKSGLAAVTSTLSGRMLLLQAEDGGGKSRILQEIRPLIQREGHRLIEARGGDVRGQPPLRQLLFSPVSLEADVNRLLIDRYQSVLQQVYSSTEPSSVAPVVGASDQLGVMDGLASFFVELATRHPLVILFDDLHRADPMTQGMFRYLGWHLREAPLLVIATLDSAFLDLREDYQEIILAGRVDVVRMPPLSIANLQDLLRDALGTMTGTARLGEILEATTGGNPAMVSEAIESLVDGGALFFERGEWHFSEEGATEVLHPTRGAARSNTLLKRRLDALSQVDRELLLAAAILGIEFDEKALSGLVGGGAWVGEALQRLERRGILLRSRDQTHRLRFQQPRLCPFLLEQLPLEVRRALHRRAGQYVLTTLGAVANAEKLPDSELDELAQHFLASGDLDSGRTFGLLAAARAEQNQALRQALERYQQLIHLAQIHHLEIPPDIQERIADQHLKLGQIDDALILYESLLEPDTPWDEGWIQTTGQLSPLARIYSKLATVYGELGDWNRALSALDEALLMVPASDVRNRIWLLGLRSPCLLMLGDLDGAEKAALEGLELVGERPLPWHTAPAMKLTYSLAEIAVARGRLEEVEELVKRGLSLANPRNITLQPQALREIRKLSADMLFVRGVAQLQRGAFPEAIRATLDALNHYESLRDLTFQARCHRNVGAASFAMGEWLEAIDHWERFRSLAERARATSELGLALRSLGRVYREIGRFEESAAAFEQALKLARKTEDPTQIAVLLSNLGEARARQGHLRESRRLYDQAFELLGESPVQPESVEVYRRAAELYLEEGHLSKARRMASAALEMAKQHKLKLEEASLHALLGAEAAAREMTDRALAHFRKGDELLCEMHAELERARLKYKQGQAFVRLGFPSEAENALRYCEEVFRRLEASWDLRRTQEALAGLSSDGGRTNLAFRKLQLLLEVTRTLSGEIELEPLLDRILEKALDLTRTERGFVILLDPEGHPVFHSTRRMARAEVETGKVAQLSSTVLRRVIQTGTALAVTNIEQEFDLRTQNSIVELGLRAIMCAPIKRGERLLGLIYVDSSRITEGFYQADVSLLEALADTAAISLENAQLVDSLRRKTELMSILAHEFRTPTASTIAFAQQALQAEGSLSAEQQESLEAIREQGYRLSRMIDNILSLARMENSKVEWEMAPLKMDDVVAAAVRGLAALARERAVSVVIVPTKAAERVYGSRDRLIQVCTNLLGNALKFVPEGGRVEIETELSDQVKTTSKDQLLAESEREAWVTRNLAPGFRLSDTRYLNIRFRDNGPGIPPQDLGRIFERYAQSGDAASKSRGTGLGLTISMEIVKLHGGRVWAENHPAGGAVLVVSLPILTEESPHRLDGTS